MQNNRFILTELGADLLAFCQSGEPLNFTRFEVGDGEILSTKQMRKLKKLISPKQSAEITGVTPNHDGTATISTLISNAKLEEGYLAKESGIYADDPRYGEILYAVAANTTYPDWIPPGSGSEEYSQLIDIIVVIGNTQHLTINIDTSLVFVTWEQLSNLAGRGRTIETVKKNADDIRDLLLRVLTLESRDITAIGSNKFTVMFTDLDTSVEWGGVYDPERQCFVI